MSLLTSFLPKKETANNFIVLGLEENHVRAAVAEMLQDKVKILGTGKGHWDTPEKETEAVDLAVSMAEKQISEETLVENVIFALPQFYIEGENVKPEYLSRLKKIAKELDLKAYGFVEYATAVTNYLTTVEGSAPTVLLLDLSGNHLTATLVRIGKIVKNITVERTDSLVADFARTLPGFEVEILPSRIIIFDIALEKNDVREELLKFPWHKHSVFLHTPKMDLFDNEKILKAIVEAAASSFLPNIKESMETTEEVAEATPAIKDEILKETQSRQETVELLQENAEEKRIHEELFPDREKPGKGEKFGFAEEALTESTEPIMRETAPVAGRAGGRKFDPAAIISGFTSRLKVAGFKPKLPGMNFSIPRINVPFKGALLLIPVIALIVFGIYLARSYPTATVYLLTYPAKSDTAIDVVFSKEGGGEGSVAIRTVSEEASGSKTAKATGTNQIGEKAKGEVTIYNKNTSSRTIPKGAVIASGPVRFTLDNDVKTASASETTEGITFGKTTVKVSAAAIGPESNLPANTNFTFSDSQFSSLTAKNNLPFSGGTAREITAVSKEDRDKLEAELVKELVATAKQKMLQSVEAGDKLLDEPVNTVVSAKKFSHEAGTEAKDISLEMTLKVEGLAYNPRDLEDKASVLSAQVPSGYTLDPTRISTRVVESKTNKAGDIEAKVVITSYYTREFDLPAIKEEIKGKEYNAATNILATHKEIAGARIVPDRTLPLGGGRLPQLTKNINLLVTSR